MFVIAGVVLGALGGAWQARRRGGRPADIALYATVFAMLFGLLGLFLTLILDRMLRG
jgi:hypothetical protein